MPVPFDALTFKLAKDKVAKPTWFDDNKALAFDDEPDHYLKGRGFLGPTGNDTAGMSEQQLRAAQTAAQTIADGIKRNFTEEDVLSEVTGRRADGAVGLQPRVAFQVARILADDEQPTSEEQARLDEMAALLQWMADRDFLSLLGRAVRAMSCFRWSYLRPVVPTGRLKTATAQDEDGAERSVLVSTAETPADALQDIFLEVVLPDTAVMVEDPDTKERAGVVFIEGQARPDGSKTPDVVEVSYPDPERETTGGAGEGERTYPDTTLRQIRSGEGAEERAQLPLRGRPLLVELEDHKLFIDRPMRQLQKAANTASTQRRIINNELSLPIRVLLGASPPGATQWVEGPNEEYGIPAGQRALVHVPTKLVLLPGDFLTVQGEAIHDPDVADATGRPVVKDVTTPSIGQFDAADPKALADEVLDRKRAIRERAKQAWVETTSQADIAGVSRKVAMEDFLADARKVAGLVNVAGAAVLELVWDLACYLAKVPARDYDLEVEFECRVSAPPPTPAEQAEILRQREAGLLSTERAMSQLGIDDPTAERERVRQERAEAQAALDGALVGLLGGEGDRQDDEPGGGQGDPVPDDGGGDA